MTSKTSIARPKRIASDSGPLISLEKVNGGFTLLHQLFDRVFIPPEVLTELIGDGRFGLRYLEYHHIDTLVEVVEAPAPPVEILTLDDGEQAAISLALKRC